MISKTRRTRRTRRNRISKSRKIYGGKKDDEFKWELGEGVIIYRKEGYIFDDYRIEYTPPQSTEQSASANPEAHTQAISAPISKDQCGVGIMLAERNGYLTVVGLVPGGPADKTQAIQKGDLLVEIDGKSVVGKDILEQVHTWFLGVCGSSITIGLARTPDSEPERITLIRDKPPSDLPLKEDLIKKDFKKLKTQYNDWTLNKIIPMITSQMYGIDKFVKKVFFIQSTAIIIRTDSSIYTYAEPFWKPFSLSVLTMIKQNNEAHEKFIQLRDAILKFSAEHDDLDRLKIKSSPYNVHENTHEAGHGSTRWFSSSNSVGLGPLGLMGLI